MEYIPSYIDQIDVDYLMHYGVKGMKWGVRRYQNYDGTRIKKAPIGSINRVRQKQDVLRSKINSDGILGKGDIGFVRRNTINDWRRGRIEQLEAKAQNRQAIRDFNKNKTKANAKKVVTTGAKRAVLNTFVPSAIGQYKRRKNDDKRSTAYALGSTAFTYALPAARVGQLAGEALVDKVRPNSNGMGGSYTGNAKYIKRRKDYAKKTRQTSRL